MGIKAASIKLMVNTTVNKYIVTCLLCLLCGLFWAQNKSSNIQTIDGKKYYIHKIEKSQSLYAISKLYSVTLEDLYSLNPELKAGAKAGQDIKIPFAGAVPVQVTTATMSPATGSNVPVDTTKYITYKVSKGETLYSVTHKFNITEKQLNTYNPSLAKGLKDGQLIIVGEKPKRKSTTPKELKETKVPVAKEKENKLPTVVVDSSAFKPVSKPRKPTYNVALVLPFKLDQTLALELGGIIKANGNFPAVPALAVDFYLGFKRAMDSLTGNGYEINLELYDVDEDSVKLVQLVNNARFKDFDLIFGPLYANGFKTIAKKAKELHIPIVSPITQQNKFLFNNIYISKTNPSQFTLLESLADYCIDSLVQNNANIMLMAANEKDKKELSFVTAFKKYYNEKQKLLGKLPKDTVRLVHGLAGLKAAYVPNVKNIVISLSNNPVFIADFTTQLALFADKKDVVLCGWESTSTNDNIDQEYLNQLGYTFPHQYNIINTNSYFSVIDYYHQQQETAPSDYFFMGFDIAYYYLKNLRDNGPDFIYNLNNLPMETNFMRFKFSRPDAATGFDNRGVYIFRYNEYQLRKTGWK